MAFLLGHVDLLAARAIDFDSGSADFLAHTDGQSVLALAQHPRTHSESSLQVLVPHDRQPLGGHDVPGVDEAIDVGGFLIDGEVAG